MKNHICTTFLILLALSLNACVEVRDQTAPEDSSAPAPVVMAEPTQASPDLIIDQVMYVYQNQILTMDEIERMTYKSKPDWTPSAVTLNYHRVEITYRGRLVTMGNDLKLIVDEFVSDRGQIETLPSGTKADLNVPGMNGGDLTLRAGHAEGQLFVTLRGQEGGDGLPAPDQKRVGFCAPAFDARQLDAVPGEAGRAGGDTGSLRVQGNTQGLDVRFRREPGRGGQGGAAGMPGQCADQVSNGQIHWAQGHAAPAGARGSDGRVLE